MSDTPRTDAAVAKFIKPVAWVLPGDDKERDGGWLDARIDDEGEFTKPLYDESAILQAKEEGRREGMREALRVSEQAVSDLAQIYGLLQEGKVDEAEDYCRCAAEGYTQDIATFSETPGASAITRTAIKEQSHG